MALCNRRLPTLRHVPAEPPLKESCSPTTSGLPLYAFLQRRFSHCRPVTGRCTFHLQRHLAAQPPRPPRRRSRHHGRRASRVLQHPAPMRAMASWDRMTSAFPDLPAPPAPPLDRVAIPHHTATGRGRAVAQDSLELRVELRDALQVGTAALLKVFAALGAGRRRPSLDDDRGGLGRTVAALAAPSYRTRDPLRLPALVDAARAEARRVCPQPRLPSPGTPHRQRCWAVDSYSTRRTRGGPVTLGVVKGGIIYSHLCCVNSLVGSAKSFTVATVWLMSRSRTTRGPDQMSD